MGKFRIITLNVRGLKNARKRKMVFEFLLHYNFDVCLLQEVHLKDEGDIDLFTEEWRGGESAWSIGGVHGTGVGVLCGNKSIRIKESYTLIQGRVMVVDVEKSGMQNRIINVYAHVDPMLRRELLLKMDTCFMTKKKYSGGRGFQLHFGEGKILPPLQDFHKKIWFDRCNGYTTGETSGAHMEEYKRGGK